MLLCGPTGSGKTTQFDAVVKNLLKLLQVWQVAASRRLYAYSKNLTSNLQDHSESENMIIKVRISQNGFPNKGEALEYLFHARASALLRPQCTLWW